MQGRGAPSRPAECTVGGVGREGPTGTKLVLTKPRPLRGWLPSLRLVHTCWEVSGPNGDEAGCTVTQKPPFPLPRRGASPVQLQQWLLKAVKHPDLKINKIKHRQAARGKPMRERQAPDAWGRTSALWLTPWRARVSLRPQGCGSWQR